jgi:ribulose-bisphosphate carboxylase large chain
MRIFISYRRSCSWGLAKLIYDELTARGFDVFMDLEEIRGGDFEQIINEQIDACDYFLPIFSKDTFCLERIQNPDDWVRKEMEYALSEDKAIIPLLAEGFPQLDENSIPSTLLPILRADGIRILNDFFREGIEKLVHEYLIDKLVSGSIPVEILDHFVFQEEDWIDFEDYLIATFECEADEKAVLEDAIRTIAYDPTIGTWTTIADVDREEILASYCGKVLLPLPTGENHRGRVRIAIPVNNIDPAMGGIPHLLAVLGAPFGLKMFKSLRLLNIQFPDRFTEQFSGPRFGLEGIYQLLGQEQDRPLLATMLKPRSGLSPDAYAKVAYEALIGGVDIIFDDELMVSPKSAPLEKRVSIVDAAVEQAAVETGLHKYYAVNITSSLRLIAQTALMVKELGADLIYFNPLTSGFSGLEILAQHDEIDLPILCCRSMQGVFHRGEHGIDLYVLMKLARIAGADGMHIGSISGKLPHLIAGGKDEIRNRARTLTGRSRYLKPMIPILSGGLHPGNVEWNIRNIGHKVILQAGSGVLGHPDGARAGGQAMRAVVDGLMMGQHTYQISRKNKAVMAALKKWGFVEKGKVKSV